VGPAFDIFRLQKDGVLLWCDVAQTLEIAKLRVQSLSISSPGRYVILSQNTGKQTVLEPDSAGAPRNTQ
jgi:hypothetical protein